MEQERGLLTSNFCELPNRQVVDPVRQYRLRLGFVHGGIGGGIDDCGIRLRSRKELTDSISTTQIQLITANKLQLKMPMLSSDFLQTLPQLAVLANNQHTLRHSSSPHS